MSFKLLCATLTFFIVSTAFADENLFGYVKGSETLPKGTWEFYQIVTSRDDKGAGSYHAINTETEIEYGFTDSLNVMLGLQMQAINTHGLTIDGYLPMDKSYGLQPSSVETAIKYNYLSPAKDVIGLSTVFELNYGWLDPHSGQEKEIMSAGYQLILQKYFLEGQMVWVGNLGLESTYAKRGELNDLPAGFDWPTHPEMEIETILGTGLTYRFMPNWFLGAEALNESEYETEVGRERWTLFAGPTLHYGGQVFWASLTYLPQIMGGGEEYVGQAEDDMHLIEKTKTEMRLKIGATF